jgi:hypothetical protein
MDTKTAKGTTITMVPASEAQAYVEKLIQQHQLKLKKS